MRENIIALVYVAVIGYTAFRLTSGTFAQYNIVDSRKLILFLFANAMGFVVAPTIGHSPLVFYSTVGALILVLKPRDSVHQVALFLFLLPLMPMLSHQLTLGPLPLIDLTWSRLLAIFLLVPLVPRALKSQPLFHYRVDKYVWLFLR